MYIPKEEKLRLAERVIEEHNNTVANSNFALNSFDVHRATMFIMALIEVLADEGYLRDGEEG